jgi:CheY-like chemotaxis protein
MMPTVEAEMSATPTVLVVDDDAVIRLVVAEALRDAGLNVVEAGCADEAITYLRSGSRVDLIFSDINMAGPFDGLFLANHVQAIYPTVPIILTSGTGKPTGLHGAEVFISKPYKLDAVVGVIIRTAGSTEAV